MKADGHRAFEHPRTAIVLRPVGSGLPLGFFSFGIGMLILACQAIGWIPVSEQHEGGMILISFVFPLELVATIFAFLARDTLGATTLGLFTTSWLAVGWSQLESPPGTTSATLGIYLFGFATAVLLLAALSTAGKPFFSVLLSLAATRMVLSGAWEVGSEEYKVRLCARSPREVRRRRARLRGRPAAGGTAALPTRRCRRVVRGDRPATATARGRAGRPAAALASLPCFFVARRRPHPVSESSTRVPPRHDQIRKDRGQVDPVTERDSNKHSPRLDDQLKKEVDSLTRGSPAESRKEEWREQEGAADDEREPSSRTGDPGALGPDNETARAELSRHLSAFPGDRESLLAEAEANAAPGPVLAALRRLPDGSFETVYDVWAALGGTVEHASGRPDHRSGRTR